ncbi:MAG TPA: MBL fold metallo-hydrolase [Acidimicrobiales bacterium]|nr:MBL fold metallo-hydrolase [Acidimicrobiales bacterium]
MRDLPVADPWFVRERIDDTLTLVTEPHVHPLLRCNVWHVRGRDRDLVVDTALGLRPLRHLVERELDGPLLAVATHTHGDHTGGLHEFAERAVHRAEAARLDGSSAIVTTLDATQFGDAVVAPYRDAGYDIPDVLVDAVPAGPPLGLAVEVAPAPATWVLDEGDVIDLGDRAFEVLHLPGHSPGSIGLWDAVSGTLFSGDAVYDGPLLDEIDGSDIDDYLATMERLRELPVTVVHGGHEPSFDRRRLVELCDAYLTLRRP